MDLCTLFQILEHRTVFSAARGQQVQKHSFLFKMYLLILWNHVFVIRLFVVCLLYPSLVIVIRLIWHLTSIFTDVLIIIAYINQNFLCIIIDVITVNVLSYYIMYFSRNKPYEGIWSGLGGECHSSTTFRLWPMRSHPTDSISSYAMANSLPIQWWIVSSHPIPLGIAETLFDHKYNSVSHQNLQITTRGQHGICHMPPMCDLLPFLGYKKHVLWLASSLRADGD